MASELIRRQDFPYCKSNWKKIERASSLSLLVLALGSSEKKISSSEQHDLPSSHPLVDRCSSRGLICLLIFKVATLTKPKGTCKLLRYVMKNQKILLWMIIELMILNQILVTELTPAQLILIAEDDVMVNNLNKAEFASGKALIHHLHI